MNLLKTSIIIFVTLALIGFAGYLVAANGMQKKPGYAKLVLPGWFSANTKVALKLGPNGLKPVRWVARRVVDDSDHQLKLSERLALKALEELQGIQLRVYEIENNEEIFERAINRSIENLKQADWRTVLSVNQKHRRIVVMQTSDDDLISGFSILVITPENAIFMNLVGPLNTRSIAVVAGR